MIETTKTTRGKNNKKKIFYITLIIFFLFLVLLALSLKESDIIVSNNGFLYENKKIVFNTPLVYASNFKKSAADPEARKINRKLLSLEEASLLNFSKFNEKNKQIEYVKSDMGFTVVKNYKVIPTDLTSLFRQTYEMYILKDEDGLLSTMPAYENKNPTDIYPVSDFNNSYINIDKKFADSIYKTDEKYPIVVTFLCGKNKDERNMKKNLVQQTRPYGIENLFEQGPYYYYFSFDGDIETILYLYTSRKDLDIEKIYIDNNKQEISENFKKNEMLRCPNNN
ncbi:MAG: hypothetical protein V1649_04005 [Patescibacteria group bacterium]